MSSLRAWATLSVIAGVVLLSPAFAFLMVIAVEIMIDMLTEVGAPALLTLVAGAIGWSLFRKMSSHTKVTPLYGHEEEALDKQAIAAP